jgi:Flp pilus assembly pilin Flp
MSKTMKPLRILLMGFLCIALSILPVPKASAVSVEYTVLLALIIVATIDVSKSVLPQGSQVVINQLKTAAEGARAANMVGNRAAELSRLSKAIGATEALMGMTSDCDECGDLRDVLQQIIGHAALLKTSIVGASGTCQPNGIIGPNEQCDPLAIQTGCPVNTIEPTYCSDECRCELAPSP